MFDNLPIIAAFLVVIAAMVSTEMWRRSCERLTVHILKGDERLLAAIATHEKRPAY